MERYLWLVFLLILAYLLFSERFQAKEIINSLSGVNVHTIEALQGRYSGGTG